jgi:hypothetical protein
VPEPSGIGWIRPGMWALPLYGLLTFAGTLTHQPDPNTDFEAYARYVSTTTYLVGHLVGSILGITLGIFGAIALGAYLAGGRAVRPALTAMVLSVAGKALILTIFGMSTFATPAVGRAYLAGQHGIVEVNQDIIGIPLILTALAGGLLYSVGAILFGVAVWRSGVLPRWAGVLYAPTGFLISILGLTVGASQTLGSLLVVVGGAWIAWTVRLRSNGTETRPRVR